MKLPDPLPVEPAPLRVPPEVASFLEELARGLANFPRYSVRTGLIAINLAPCEVRNADLVDQPEGRYVVLLSHTLAMQLAARALALASGTPAMPDGDIPRVRAMTPEECEFATAKPIGVSLSPGRPGDVVPMLAWDENGRPTGRALVHLTTACQCGAVLVRVPEEP